MKTPEFRASGYPKGESLQRRIDFMEEKIAAGFWKGWRLKEAQAHLATLNAGKTAEVVSDDKDLKESVAVKIAAPIKREPPMFTIDMLNKLVSMGIDANSAIDWLAAQQRKRA